MIYIVKEDDCIFDEEDYYRREEDYYRWLESMNEEDLTDEQRQELEDYFINKYYDNLVPMNMED